jgi:hypothetical protein
MVRSAVSNTERAASTNGVAVNEGSATDSIPKNTSSKNRFPWKRSRAGGHDKEVKSDPTDGTRTSDAERADVAENNLGLQQQPQEETDPQPTDAVVIKDHVYPTSVELCGKTVCHVRVGAAAALLVELVGCLVIIAHGVYAWFLPKHLYEVDEPSTKAILKIIKPAEMLCTIVFDFVGPSLMIISILIAAAAMKFEKIKLLIPHAIMQLVFTLGLIVQCFIIVVTPMEYHAELINKARVFDNYIPGYVLPYNKLKLFGICFGIMCMFSAAVLAMIWFIQILKYYFFYMYKKQEDAQGKAGEEDVMGTAKPVSTSSGRNKVAPAEQCAPKALPDDTVDLANGTGAGGNKKDKKNRSEEGLTANESGSKGGSIISVEATIEPSPSGSRRSVDSEDRPASQTSQGSEPVIEKLDNAVTKIVLDPATEVTAPVAR